MGALSGVGPGRGGNKPRSREMKGGGAGGGADFRTSYFETSSLPQG